MIAAVVLPMIIYAAVMVVSTGALSAGELQNSLVPVADVARVYAGEVGAVAMVIGALLATISSANASIMAAARVVFAMGTDRLLANWFGHVNDRFDTPSRTVFVTGIGAVVLVALQGGLDLLAEVAGFLFLLTYGLVHFAIIRLRHDGDDYDPKFEMPDLLYPLVPVVGILATVGIATQMTPQVIVGGLLLVAAGIVWYFVTIRI